MSLVSGYPPSQAYHPSAPSALPNDFPYAAAYGHQGGIPSRYPDHGGASAAADPTCTSGGGAYFHSWMINPHSQSGGSPHPAELPPGVSPGDPGPHVSYSGGGYTTDFGSMSMLTMLENSTVRVRCVKRRSTANRKERRRTLSINSAFASLRGCIPNVPSDTKLSKIKTLRLATSYIAYLMDVLNKEDSKLDESGFKAEITKKMESREEKRKREAEEILRATSKENRKSKGRTGWPQQVWAAELK